MIKLTEIGKEYTVSYNSLTFTVTIKNDPSQYEYYKTLGLDVFEKSQREILKFELDELGVKYRKNGSLEYLTKKLNDSKQSDSEHESSNTGLEDL